MRIDFHCHIFHNVNAFQAFKLHNQKFSGYGFYKRVLKMLEGINTINTDDIIRKTLYYLESVKIDKAVMLPVSEKENELKNPIIKLQKQKEIKLHLDNFGMSIPKFLVGKTLIIKVKNITLILKEELRKLTSRKKPDLLR